MKRGIITPWDSMVTNFKQSGSNYSAATNFKQIWIPTESDRLLIHSKLDFCLEFVMDGQKQGESNYSAATNVKQIWVPTESDRLLIHLTFGFGLEFAKFGSPLNQTGS